MSSVLPSGAQVIEFQLPIDEFLLNVKRWSSGWRWSIWVAHAETSIYFSGDCETIGECVQRGIEATANAKMLGATQR